MSDSNDFQSEQDTSYTRHDYNSPVTFEQYQPDEEVAPIAVHQCNVCNKIFMSFKGLQQHSVIHTDSKPFLCDVCGRGFRFKSNMFEHRTVHTGYTPHLCPFCGKAFRLKGNMKKHMRVHVSNKEELEAAYRPYARNNRRTTIILPENALVIRGSPMPFPNIEKRKVAPKLLLGKDPSKWVNLICQNRLLPLSSFDDKMMRAAMRTSECKTLTDLLETSKALDFEIYLCPFCKCACEGREDCELHIRDTHGKTPQDMSNEPNYCLKCMRLFTDGGMFLQHQSYHSRIQLMIRNNEVNMGFPEVDLSQICYSMLPNGNQSGIVETKISDYIQT